MDSWLDLPREAETTPQPLPPNLPVVSHPTPAIAEPVDHGSAIISPDPPPPILSLVVVPISETDQTRDATGI